MQPTKPGSPPMFRAAKSREESTSNKPGGTAGSIHQYAPAPGHAGVGQPAAGSSFPRIERSTAQPFPMPTPSASAPAKGSVGAREVEKIFPAAKQ